MYLNKTVHTITKDYGGQIELGVDCGNKPFQYIVSSECIYSNIQIFAVTGQ